MMVRIAAFLAVGGFAWIFAQNVSPHSPLLVRRYQEGERTTYRMRATNNNWRYEIWATSVAKRDSAGKYVEEYAWSKLISNGTAVALPPSSVEFRQVLSLDPDRPPSIPNLSVVHRMMIGPITDLATFYADLWLVMRVGKLTHPGDHFYQKGVAPASWADGHNVVLGEDSVDFHITLLDIDQFTKIATLLVRHVPPERPQVRFPASWMKESAAGTPNNWVQVSRKGGGFVAAVGQETFDVRMQVSLADGKILSGNIENLVVTRERDCRDAALKSCGDPRFARIFRKIEISLIH